MTFEEKMKEHEKNGTDASDTINEQLRTNGWVDVPAGKYIIAKPLDVPSGFVLMPAE